MSFISNWNRSLSPTDDDEIIAFSDEKVMYYSVQSRFYTFAEISYFTSGSVFIFLGTIKSRKIFLLRIDKNPSSDILFLDVRSAISGMSACEFEALSAAKITNHWIINNKYCGRCSEETALSQNERAIICPCCGNKIFPKISPAVIVAVQNGEKILLGHNARFPHGLYSLIAGFIDPGENIQSAAKREVKEETGINIKNIRFFGSQHWPFPDSLMIGLMAEYDSGKPNPDNIEITDLKWFDMKNPPILPMQESIARKILNELYPHLKNIK